MKYGNIRKRLLELAKKYNYGFSSNQLYEDSKKENMGLDKKQVLDFLYKSNYVLYDKKRKVFMLNLAEQTQVVIKTAEDLKKISELHIEKQLEREVAKIIDSSLVFAQKGQKEAEVDIISLIHKEDVFKRLISLGFGIGEVVNDKVKISW